MVCSLLDWVYSLTHGFPQVSLVDGYNLPMRITNNKGCPVAECAVDLGPNCERHLGEIRFYGFCLTNDVQALLN